MTANPQTKVYGATDPALTYAASGFQFSDSGTSVLTGSLARAAGENVGSYAIDQGTLAADSNYTISFTGNTLTITPAPLTVTVTGSATYGDVSATESYVVSGFVLNDNASVLGGTAS